MLKRYGHVSKKTVDDVVKKFVNCNLVKRERHKKGSEYDVRLHDLVLYLCQQAAQDSQTSWHKALIDAYYIPENGVCEWWEVDDSRYIIPNLARHLAKGGCREELQTLLCDYHWFKKHKETGPYSVAARGE